MDAVAGAERVPSVRAEAHEPLVYRHSLAVRITHWLFSLAFFILVASGLQIFNASPNLDASDKSDPARRVLCIGAVQGPGGSAAGVTTIFGHAFTTTHVLGYTSDGMDSKSKRAFPGWITLPGYQDLAGGRRWHLFFAWIMVVCGVVYFAAGIARKDLAEIVLRPADMPDCCPCNSTTALAARTAAARKVQSLTKGGLYVGTVPVRAAHRAERPRALPGRRCDRASAHHVARRAAVRAALALRGDRRAGGLLRHTHHVGPDDGRRQ